MGERQEEFKIERKSSQTHRMQKDSLRLIKQLDLLRLVILQKRSLLHLLELGFGFVDLSDSREETSEDDLKESKIERVELAKLVD